MIAAGDFVEAWLPVPGWEGLYEASSTGKIVSLPRIDTAGNHRKPRMLVGFPAGVHQYRAVDFSRGAYRKTYLWHRVIATTFFGEPTADRPHVNHKNGIKDDNKLSNLEWCSNSENVKHCYTELQHRNARPIIARRDGNELLFVSHFECGRHFGISNTTVRNYLNASLKGLPLVGALRGWTLHNVESK